MRIDPMKPAPPVTKILVIISLIHCVSAHFQSVCEGIPNIGYYWLKFFVELIFFEKEEINAPTNY